MNRAMFSGVAGLKTHQTRMDVIGNNIANVNTYGYKSQRAVFSDIFYQTLMGASQGTASRGGRNPSTIGYGSTLGAIQTMMMQSSMQNTGFGLDVAITGEGFLQVMDPDGNIFYTKAGMLDYDANGYLVDVNGNFVLGATDVNGAPNTQKIKLDNMGAVNPAKPTATQMIEGVVYTMTAEKETKDGNVLVTITSSELPIGQKATAVISNTGAITVSLNKYEMFANIEELNTEINKAIKLANNNEPHVGGEFKLTMTDADGNDVSSKFTNSIPPILSGTAQPAFMGGARITGLSDSFPSAGPVDFTTSTFSAGNDLVIHAVVGGKDYTGTITNADLILTGKEIRLSTGTVADGYITINVPATAEATMLFGFTANLSLHDYSITPSVTTVGLTGEQIAVADFTVKPGKITGFPVAGFNFKETSNDFVGRGAVNAFTLEYVEVTPGTYGWEVSMDINGTIYSGVYPDDAAGSALMLKGPAPLEDSLTLTIPSSKSLANLYADENSGATPVVGNTLDLMALTTTSPFPNGGVGGVVEPAIPSSNLGLTSVGFNLSGGTTGGVITLDQLVSINIGADGTVSVSHADKGTVSVGKVSLANFANPRGLMQSGSNYYVETVNSGNPVLCDPGTGGTGALKANALEMSNVDLSNEFADMIVTQRGFQANTRVITVSDTMLEELINLKR